MVKQSAASDDGMHIVLLAPTGAELSLRLVQTDTGENGLLIPLAKGHFVLATVDAANDASANIAAEFEQVIRSIHG